MSGPLALIGGEEFADGFEDVHARLLELARVSAPHRNGRAVRVAFLPTCAADDGLERVDYWCDLARQRLEALGAKVSTPKIVDRLSADDPDYAQQIAEADWIYIGGGYPHVGMRILTGTRALSALETAWEAGSLVAGASAGAMMLCARSFVITPEVDEAITPLLEQGQGVGDWNIPLPPPLDCLGFVPNSLCWPHLNQLFSMSWLKSGLLPAGYTMIGVDEQTALIGLPSCSWETLGRGKVLIVDDQWQVQTFTAGMQWNRVEMSIPSAAPRDF